MSKQFIKNNKIVLNSEQRFSSEMHNDFTEEINKINKNNQLIQ